jgi:hypothetical protein
LRSENAPITSGLICLYRHQTQQLNENLYQQKRFIKRNIAVPKNLIA